MKNKTLSRKDFIKKTGKCLGGLSCLGITSTIIQSCSKPNPIVNSNSETLFLTTCSDHFATFNQDGINIALPTTGWENIIPLTKYNAELIYNNGGIEESVLITNEDNDYMLSLADHPSLKTIDGVSATNSNIFDSYGLLLYRKNETDIIVYSRRCPHAGGMLSNFL
tara:strand:+ start:302 stop:799 length:498 start_codon:yes stop_codon:yes gene_type:complete